MDKPKPGPTLDRTAMLRVRAEALIGTVSLTTELAASGRGVDLSGLDGEVGILCAQALDLGGEQATTLVPLLTTLLGRLERLESQIRAQA